ncbi:MAG: sensor histidine kinase, partial [Rikenellaceae bacterium]|nr:sensor histidine kinase [Rikenellaceae bacterium]
MKRLTRLLTFRNRMVVIALGLVLACASLYFTSRMAESLREKEQHDVQIWAMAMERSGNTSMFLADDPLMAEIISSQNNIPLIITDNNLHVLESHLIPQSVINHPDLLREKIDQLTEKNSPIVIRNRWNNQDNIYIFYGESRLLRTLYYFPLVQLLVVVIFILFGYIAFSSSKQDEQNRVWIGLAKETAHQLGTPTSSLLGWIEYLRTQEVDQTAVDEMNKDLTHLMKIVDRFSKIGSETILASANIHEVVGGCVMYFRTRIPRNVTLDYNGLATAPVQAMINAALFEWVVEN